MLKGDWFTYSIEWCPWKCSHWNYPRNG